ncbi:MAG: ketoacyl-ACP synthase III [Xanthomonadales bacterium]|nr:ketoacyl-ACP synthase III [Gammaproteobacteria bacterium]MBT8052149.1 ketoacyl-ACP synthase III [Gammaproteobacteria bacterium]MBT8056834.1 ketoacyl-ACP synthase III [Gammaproteobacteria bacterium]NNJ79484.1 ketoacyl-ACP synthase III [Xanthomonadales bacterium]NNL05622.1 ketoacyl-ACP synthase III [Xanthomonadales bacterium]
MYSRIAGTGSGLPEKIVTNQDLEKIMDTSDEWIRGRTGIAERRVISNGESTTTLAEVACRKAMEAADVDPSQIDLLVMGTTTPDVVFPSSACLIQKKLGLPDCGAMDVNAACSGFMYALSIADKFIRCGEAKKVLVCGAETLTQLVNWERRDTAVLFGDGAGAVVLEASNEAGILSTHIHANGNYADLLRTDTGVSRGFGDMSHNDYKPEVEMKGNEVFKVAVRTLHRIVEETLGANDLQKSDLDWLIPHQANLRIISATARMLDMSMDNVVVTVDRHGNTSAASVPLALDEAVRDGRIRRGELMLLEAFGGGFTWGSALIRF